MPDPLFPELLPTLALSLLVASVFGLLAARLRLPVILGYLVAGFILGPFVPGVYADVKVVNELAEIGVILMMFGVGTHFSVKDLLSVKRIAVPAALLQVASATILGMSLTWALGWSWGCGLLVGLSLSVASTVVLVMALDVHGQIETPVGKIAIGWLVVEDIFMIAALVVVPAIAPLLRGETGSLDTASLLTGVAVKLGKVALFIVAMIVLGAKLLPWFLERAFRQASHELFHLGSIAVAICVAYAAVAWFEGTFALGAFFAGVVLKESAVGRRAALDSLPLRDAMAALFFVSVGMLIDPRVVLREPLGFAGVLAIILLGKPLVGYAIVRRLGEPRGQARFLAVALAQIGEFSFILADVGRQLDILSSDAGNLILAGAVVSIAVNPLLFRWAGPCEKSDP